MTRRESRSALLQRPRPACAAIRRIVVPLNGTLSAEQTLPLALALACVCSAEIIVLRALDAAPSLPSGGGEWVFPRRADPDLSHASNRYLARMEDALRRHGVRVSSRLVSLPPAAAIIEVAAHGPADLIMLATQCVGDKAQCSAQTATTETVLRHGQTPVLLVGPDTTNPFALRSSIGLRVLLASEEAVESPLAVVYAQVLAHAFHGTVVRIGGAAYEHASGSAAAAPRLLVYGQSAEQHNAQDEVATLVHMLHWCRAPLLYVP